MSLVRKTEVWRSPQIEAFAKIKNEPSTHKDGNIFFKGTRIILPVSIEHQALEIAHTGHQGITKMKMLLREKTWFPKMDAKVTEFVQNCIAYQIIGKELPPAQLQMSEMPENQWYTVGIDFKESLLSGECLLVVIELYSKYPEVDIVKSTSAKAIIPNLDRIFATHGLQKKVKSDNGPPFNGSNIRRYFETLGIEYKTSTPIWPQGNSSTESFMKPLKKVIMTSVVEGKNWRQALQRLLKSYRNSPHTTTKVSPAELPFNRKIRGQLPEMTKQSKVTDRHKEATENNTRKKAIMKEYADWRRHVKIPDMKEGNVVLVKQPMKNKLTPRYNPEPLVVTKVKWTLVEARNRNKSVTRNVSYFKPVKMPVPKSYDESDYGEDGKDNTQRQDNGRAVNR